MLAVLSSDFLNKSLKYVLLMCFVSMGKTISSSWSTVPGGFGYRSRALPKDKEQEWRRQFLHAVNWVSVDLRCSFEAARAMESKSDLQEIAFDNSTPWYFYFKGILNFFFLIVFEISIFPVTFFFPFFGYDCNFQLKLAGFCGSKRQI